VSRLAADSLSAVTLFALEVVALGGFLGVSLVGLYVRIANFAGAHAETVLLEAASVRA
jgi:hypothetical protein